MKEVIVAGTLTKCLNLGRAIREAREAGQDPIEAIVRFSNGWLLFQGEVLSKEWEDRGGYMYVTTHLKGLGEFEGHRMSIWFKNENHVVWRDERTFVMTPDIIAVVESEAGDLGAVYQNVLRWLNMRKIYKCKIRSMHYNYLWP